MMITSKKDLEFYKKADCMMNNGYFKPTKIQRVKNLFFPDYTMEFLYSMRNIEFCINTKHTHSFFYIINRIRFRKLSLITGFSIHPNCFEYGLVLPHYGTVVIGANNKFGKYALINTSTCVTMSNTVFGDACFLGTGSVISSRCNIGDNVIVGANSVVLNNIENGYVMVAGVPAKTVKDTPEPWYDFLWPSWRDRVVAIEELKCTF